MHLFVLRYAHSIIRFFLRTAQLFNVYVAYHYVTHFLLRALSHSLSLCQRERSEKRAYNLDTAVCNFFRKLPWLLLLFLLLIVCSLLTFLHIKIFRFQVGQIFVDAYMCVCWNVHHCVHMYMCLGSCMHANVCACARSPALRLLFVYLTVRFVCGGLISICLSASTHTFANENDYTYTHTCAHTVKLGKSAHLTILYSYKTSRQQEEKKSVRQVAAVRLTAQNKVPKFRKTMFVFLSHTISTRMDAPCLPPAYFNG